jgi:hypothetical protein
LQVLRRLQPYLAQPLARYLDGTTDCEVYDTTRFHPNQCRQVLSLHTLSRASSNFGKLSLQAGRRVRLSQVDLFADGVTVREVGEETFRLCQQYVDEIILVDTRDEM